MVKRIVLVSKVTSSNPALAQKVVVEDDFKGLEKNHLNSQAGKYKLVNRS